MEIRGRPEFREESSSLKAFALRHVNISKERCEKSATLWAAFMGFLRMSKSVVLWLIN